MSYIKLSKKIIKWEWYHDINTCRLFIHMLLMANWKDERWQGKIIPRGSFISSLQKLADETNLTVSEVRTAISHMKLTGEITSKSFSKYTVFTVNNYCQYQSFDKQIDSEIANDLANCSQTIRKQIATIEEVEEVNNINNNIYSDDGGVNIYYRAREEAEKLIVKYWGRPPTNVDVEHVRSLIIGFANGTIIVSNDRIELLEYAFECSASANVVNWNYINGVIERLKARNITTLDEAYSFDIKRENGGNGYE